MMSRSISIKCLSMFLLGFMLLSVEAGAAGRVGGGSSGETEVSVQEALSTLKAKVPDLDVAYDDQGQPYMMVSDAGLTDSDVGASAQGVAKNFISANKAAFQISNVDSQMQLDSVRKGLTGSHLFYRPVVDGLPVANAGVGVHLSKNNRIHLVRSTMKSMSTGLSGSSVLSEDEAVERLMNAAGYTRLDAPPPPCVEEAYYTNKQYRRTWRVSVQADRPYHESSMGWVDQETGQVYGLTVTSSNVVWDCDVPTTRQHWAARNFFPDQYGEDTGEAPGFDSDVVYPRSGVDTEEGARVFIDNGVVGETDLTPSMSDYSNSDGSFESHETRYSRSPLYFIRRPGASSYARGASLQDDLWTSTALQGGYAWPIETEDEYWEDYGIEVNDNNMTQMRKEIREDENYFPWVNAYHHITQTQAKIQCLGYTDVVNYPIPYDASTSSTTGPNAYFSPVDTGAGRGYLVFFDDDYYQGAAEDGEVIVHEYAHAVQWNIQKNIGDTYGAAAMGEGFADTISFLMLENTSPDHREQVPCIAEWFSEGIYSLGGSVYLDPQTEAYCLRYHRDGYEGVPKRTMDDFETLVEDYGYHNAGQIIGSAIYTLYDKWATDAGGDDEAYDDAARTLLTLCIEALYFTDPGQSLEMPEFAELMLIADKFLYSGEHFEDLVEEFKERLFLDPDYIYTTSFVLQSYESDFGIIRQSDIEQKTWTIRSYDTKRQTDAEDAAGVNITIEMSGDGSEGFEADPSSATVTTDGADFVIQNKEDISLGAKYFPVIAYDTSDEDVFTSRTVTALVVGANTQMADLPDSGRRLQEVDVFTEGTIFYFEIDDDCPVREVNLSTYVSHESPEDLKFYVMSPQGTESYFDFTGKKDIPTISGILASVGSEAFNGEAARGTWRVRILDDQIGVTGFAIDLGLEVNTTRTDSSNFWYIAGGDTSGDNVEKIATYNTSGRSQIHRFTYYTSGLANTVDYDVAAYGSLVIDASNDIASAHGLTVESIREIEEVVNGVTVITEVPGDPLMASGYVGFPATNSSTGRKISVGGSYAIEGHPEPKDAWYFGEGATTDSFETGFYLFNPNTAAAVVTVTCYTSTQNKYYYDDVTVPGLSQIFYDAANTVGSEMVFGTSVISTNGVSIVATRLTNWDSGDFPGIGAASSAGINELTTEQYFATGSTQGTNETYLAVVNPSTESFKLKLTFYRTGDAVILTRYLDMPTRIRKTVNLADVVSGESLACKVESVDGVSEFFAECTTYYDSTWLEWAAGYSSGGSISRYMNSRLLVPVNSSSEIPYLTVVNPTNYDVNLTINESEVYVDSCNKTEIALYPFTYGGSSRVLQLESEQGAGLIIGSVHYGDSGVYDMINAWSQMAHPLP